MNDDAYKRLQARAKRKAQASGLGREADDFAGYATVRTLEGSHATTDQLWIDYLRENYGDARTKHHKGQQRLYPKTISARTFLIAVETADRDVDFGFIQRFLSENGSWFSARDRAVLTLKYQWGFTGPELAGTFGVTEARVSQIVAEIHERIRLAIEHQDTKKK